MKKVKYLILIISTIILITTMTSINAIDNNNTIEKQQINTNTSSIKSTNTNNIIINNDNYNKYFDEDGYIINDDIKENSTLILNGKFEDKNFNIENKKINIKGNNSQLIGTTIEITGKPVTISNININNAKKELNSAIIFNTPNCILENSNITDYTTKEVKEIYITEDNNTIRNNNIIIGGSSDEIDWYSDPDLAKTLSIAIVSNNNIIQYNNITTYTTISKIKYGAIESITIQGSISGQHSENNTIEYNNIKTNGTDYAYGINLGQNIDNNIIRYNNITTIGNEFADSIQAFSAVNNLTIIKNNITTISNNLSDAIAISKDNMEGKTTNNTIIDNNLYVTGYTSTLIDTGNLINSTIKSNKAIINATNTQGFIINGFENNIENNYINLTSKTKTDSAITMKNSKNNNITKNNINTNTNYTIKLTNSTDNTITDNILYAIILKSDNSIITDNKNNNIKNNKPIKTIITIENITATINDTINLKATILSDDGKKVNNGKIVFKINQKTIRDEYDNVLYIKVVNGIAQLKDYKLTTTKFSTKNYTLTAVYSGSKDYESSRSNNSTLIINKQKATITITTKNTQKSNTTITLKAKISNENNIPVNMGKVIFKINQKTLKNQYNQTIYAKVINSIATITYKLPVLSPKNYTLTAVYGDSIYDRLETSIILTITS